MHKVGQHGCSCKGYPAPAVDRFVTQRYLRQHGARKMAAQSVPTTVETGSFRQRFALRPRREIINATRRQIGIH
jgi:hypothetical protein